MFSDIVLFGPGKWKYPYTHSMYCSFVMLYTLTYNCCVMHLPLACALHHLQ